VYHFAILPKEVEISSLSDDDAAPPVLMLAFVVAAVQSAYSLTLFKIFDKLITLLKNIKRRMHEK
jgi:hypothetical protein